MGEFITFESVTFLVALGGVAFGIYHFFRNPDVEADKRISLLEQMIKDKDINTALLLKERDNHLHTLQISLDENRKEVRKLSDEMISLKAIISERLPNK